MFLSYNGVNFDLLQLDRVDRTTVFTPDGTTVLYTEWAIAASCVYSPTIGSPGNSAHLGGTSVYYPSASTRPDNDPTTITKQGQNFLPFPLTQPGPEQAILTDRELLRRLSIPRRTFTIWGYDRTGNVIIWLQSPRIQDNNTILPRDARNGPIVQALPVTTIIGTGKTFGVQLDIKTWVTPCPNGSDRLILAHRWQMTHEHDEDYYLTRKITGEVHFNGGVKDLFTLRPEIFRGYFFHPIPLGFQRSLGPISRSPDGLVIRYSFADTDQKVVFDPGKSGATHMEIVENFVYRSPWAQAEEAMKRLVQSPLGTGGGGVVKKRVFEPRGDPNAKRFGE